MRRLRSNVAHIGAGLCAVNLAFCAPGRESNESASRVRCEYGPVQSLGPIVNSPAFDGSPTASADETELFFTSERKGLLDLFVSTRPNREAAWTAPVNLGPPVDDPARATFLCGSRAMETRFTFHRLATAVLVRPTSMLRRALRGSTRGALPPTSVHGSTRTRSKRSDADPRGHDAVLQPIDVVR
jgi:WD40-like Beta Propeller Repeat